MALVLPGSIEKFIQILKICLKPNITTEYMKKYWIKIYPIRSLRQILVLLILN